MNEIPEFDVHRSRLFLIAQILVTRKWQRKLSPEDLVQDVMKTAHEKIALLDNPTDSDSVRRWLTEILRNKWIDTQKRFHALKRDIRLEQSLAHEFDDYVANLDELAPAIQTSPSGVAVRNEDFARLAMGIRKLSEEQRDAIVQKHFHGLTTSEIAINMNKSPKAVIGLLRRGITNLRKNLTE